MLPIGRLLHTDKSLFYESHSQERMICEHTGLLSNVIVTFIICDDFLPLRALSHAGEKHHSGE